MSQVRKTKTKIYVLLVLCGLLTPAFSGSYASALANPIYRFTKVPFLSTGGSWANNTVTATDKDGNVYVTGLIADQVVLDGEGGSANQTGAASGTSYIAKYSSDGTYEWSRTTSLGDSSNWAFPNAVTVDNNGNVYWVNEFAGSLTFDGPGGSDIISESGQEATAVTKLSSSGSYDWTQTFQPSGGPSSWSNPTSAATDSSGNVYVSSTFVGTVTFDPVGSTDNFDGGNSGAAAVTKLAPNGSYDWTKYTGVTTGVSHADNYAGIGVDSSGNIYEVGGFAGPVTFDDPGGSHTISPTGVGAVYISKYGPSGNYLWTKTLEAVDQGMGADSMTVTSSGNVLISGNFDGTVIFDGPGGSHSITDANASDGNMFVAEYSSDGNYKWVKVANNTNGGVSGNVIRADANGNAYVAGSFSGTIIFGDRGHTDTETITNGNDNLFISSYGSDGSYRWTKAPDLGSDTNNYIDGAGGMSIYANQLYVSGTYNGNVIFDGPGGSDVPNAGNVSNDGYLTSWLVDTSSVSLSQTNKSSAIGDPNTGMGKPTTNYSAMAVAIMATLFVILGFSIHRSNRSQLH